LQQEATEKETDEKIAASIREKKLREQQLEQEKIIAESGVERVRVKVMCWIHEQGKSSSTLIGTKRYESHSGGEREIQRTMLELLNQLDGFDSRGDVKVIMATNRIETLDPSLIRPGRIDRKIEFPLPNEKTKRRIFQIHTSKMTLADDVDLEEYIMAKDDLSGADIKIHTSS
uniref:ATPase AAA-type core domain-containing protein n=1 Tax=Amphimedon queenslandica TaxID=400682 RepID=A0A1X7TJQ5_AMPQE